MVREFTASESLNEALPTAQLDACAKAIERSETDVRAFIDIDMDAAKIRAAQLEELDEANKGVLHGLPIAIKEIIDTKGMSCPWGARAHAGRCATKDADVVRKLRAAGGNIIGTTVSTEYAIASAGKTRNPLDIRRTPGGSSSGSAAAVAAGMAPLAVGTQTIGSIIRPALYCGVPGFKLSYGHVDLEGVMPLQGLLDHVGVMAKDWWLVDSALIALGLPAYVPERPKRCFVVETDIVVSDVLQDARRVALSKIEDIGFQIVDAPKLSADRKAINKLAHDLTVAGLSINHGRDYNLNLEKWSKRAEELLVEGRLFSSRDIELMSQECAEYRADVAMNMAHGDIYLSDAINHAAPMWTADRTGNNELQAIWSVLGLPTAAWPIGKDPLSNMPIGVQISAAIGSDRWLAKLMADLESGANASHSSKPLTL